MESLGVIFDIDGVLVDSNPVHFESWVLAAKEDGVEFTEKLFKETFGQTSRAIIENNWPHPLTSDQIHYFDQRKETIYRDHFDQNVSMIPGVFDFIEYLRQRDIPMAAGSSGPKINVDYVLDKIGVRPFLKAVVSGTDVERGKPFPDIFLCASEQMNVPPDRCVVIDDSLSGVQAAKAAGMKVFGFFSWGHEAREYEKADWVVRSFQELTPLFDQYLNFRNLDRG
ncbi:MAG: HAD family phosphatase [Planctomycetia bacterium]|nr:HAD family phosphatase [Planctomycetia bacterium]